MLGTFRLISHNFTPKATHPTISSNLHRSISLMPVNHPSDDGTQRIQIFPPTLIHDTHMSCTLHDSFKHFNSTMLMCSNLSHRKSVWRGGFLPIHLRKPTTCPSVTIGNLTVLPHHVCSTSFTCLLPHPMLHLHGQLPPIGHTVQASPTRTDPLQTPSDLMLIFHMRAPTLVPQADRACLVPDLHPPRTVPGMSPHHPEKGRVWVHIISRPGCGSEQRW